MTNHIKNAAKYLSEKVYKTFSKNSGDMLLATSIIGITASSLAQMGVIFFNDKYTDSHKSFMISQEATEALLSVVSIFLVTKPIQKITLKALQSGKILSKDLIAYMEKNQLISKRGKTDFNIKSNIKKIINDIEKSDRFIKSSSAERITLLSEHKKAIQDYNIIADSSMAIATTGAVALSTALIIPLGRNRVASYCQKKHMQYKDQQKNNTYLQTKSSLYPNKPL